MLTGSWDAGCCCSPALADLQRIRKKPRKASSSSTFLHPLLFHGEKGKYRWLQARESSGQTAESRTCASPPPPPPPRSLTDFQFKTSLAGAKENKRNKLENEKRKEIQSFRQDPQVHSRSALPSLPHARASRCAPGSARKDRSARKRKRRLGLRSAEENSRVCASASHPHVFVTFSAGIRTRMTRSSASSDARRQRYKPHPSIPPALSPAFRR